MLKNSFLRAVIVIAMGVALIVYSEAVARYIVQGIGVLFILPGLVTAFSGFVKDEYNRTVPLMPILVGGGSVLMGVVLLLFPEYFISILVYLLAGVLLLGSSVQLVQLLKLKREGMQHGIVYYLFPIIVFLIGIYILLHPMETAGFPFLFIGYATLLFGVVELLTLLRVYRFRYEAKEAQRKAQNLVRDAQDNAENVVEEACLENTADDASSEDK